MTMTHCTREDLELYRSRQMSLLKRIACASHLKACPDCARLLRELEEDDRLIAEIRSSVELYQNLSGPAPAAPTGK